VLLLPLATATSAEADSAPSHKGKITLGAPEKVTSLTEESTSADVSTKALACPVGTAANDRVESCSNYRIPVTFTLNGQLVGTATLYSKATAELNPRNRYEWKQKVELRLTDPSTPAAWAVSGTVSLICNFCEATPGGTRLLVPDTTQTYDMTVKSPGRTLRQDSIVPYGEFDAPGFDDGEAALGAVFRPRCDSTPRVTPVSRGGCVYPNVAPIWQLDTGNPRVDSVAWHVDWAQRNLKQPWGVPNTQYPLHRTFDNTVIAANRDVACGRDVPRPPAGSGLSCDEYPFAQSLEGASRNPDYSCHFLDGRDNSREGSLRKAFLNSMRVLEEDAFYVRVIKPVGAVAPRADRADLGALGPVGCGSD
jgi:hypothetical protein